MTRDPAHDYQLGPIVDALTAPDDVVVRAWKTSHCDEPLPSRAALIEIAASLWSVLFPGHHGASELSADGLRYRIGATLDRVAHNLEDQVRRGLSLECAGVDGCCDERRARAFEVTRAFIARLPDVRRMLISDVLAAYEGDPAATSPDEAIFCYPGIKAITHHRLAHELYCLDVPLLPRILSEAAHSDTGVDIHPGARIGERFFIDHGTGVVIGETAVIGNRVRIYQGVTLGAKSFPRDESGALIKNIPRHPLVEDDVIIYSGATILGRVTIGKGAVIGGNVWVTSDVAPGARVALSNNP